MSQLPISTVFFLTWRCVLSIVRPLPYHRIRPRLRFSVLKATPLLLLFAVVVAEAAVTVVVIKVVIECPGLHRLTNQQIMLAQALIVGRHETTVKPAIELGMWRFTAIIAWIMDHAYQGHHPPSKLAAIVASNQFSVEQNRCIDTGATDHITLASKISLCAQIIMGLTRFRWAMVQVCIFLTLDPILFPLLLHLFVSIMCFIVPTISTNHISVHHFRNDNNCFLFFI